jgi:hypothetical protein
MPRYYFRLTDGKQVLDTIEALICRLIDLVSMLIDGCDKPPCPIPTRHCIAVFEVVRERHRIGASSSITPIADA